jgi:hypothetical protein
MTEPIFLVKVLFQFWNVANNKIFAAFVWRDLPSLIPFTGDFIRGKE